MATHPKPIHYQRRSDIVMRAIAGETVLVPIRQNLGDLESIYTLNQVGTFIWERLAEPITETQLAVAVEEEFEGEPATIRRDLTEFLGDLIAVRAITRLENNSGVAH